MLYWKHLELQKDRNHWRKDKEKSGNLIVAQGQEFNIHSPLETGTGTRSAQSSS